VVKLFIERGNSSSGQEAKMELVVKEMYVKSFVTFLLAVATASMLYGIFWL